MCSDGVNKSEKNLSASQKYQIKSILFIVEPVFNENSDKTLGKALISLMNDEISKL